MNGDIKARIILCYMFLGFCLAAAIGLGIVAVATKPSKHYVQEVVAKATGGSNTHIAAIGACEAGVQNAAQQNAEVVMKWISARYEGEKAGKTLVDVRALIGDGYGDNQKFHVECSLTKGVYQLSGITAKK